MANAAYRLGQWQIHNKAFFFSFFFFFCEEWNYHGGWGNEKARGRGARARPGVMKGHVARCDKCSPDFWFITVGRLRERRAAAPDEPVQSRNNTDDFWSRSSFAFHVFIHLFEPQIQAHSGHSEAVLTSIALKPRSSWLTPEKPSLRLNAAVE